MTTGSERKIPGRAQTNEEKRAIIERIYVAWTTGTMSHLRLGQLIVNAHGSDLFHAEDTQLAEEVEDLISR